MTAEASRPGDGEPSTITDATQTATPPSGEASAARRAAGAEPPVSRNVAGTGPRQPIHGEPAAPQGIAGTRPRHRDCGEPSPDRDNAETARPQSGDSAATTQLAAVGTGPLLPIDLQPSMIRGAVEIETTARGLLPHRLPRWARRQIPDRFLVQTSAESAGIRLAIRTAANVIELDVQARRIADDATTPFPDSVYELTEAGAPVARAGAVAGSRFVFTFDKPSGEIVTGPDATVRFAGLADHAAGDGPVGRAEGGEWTARGGLDGRAAGGEPGNLPADADHDGPNSTVPPDHTGTGPASGIERELELWLPYHDQVELLGLRADAPVTAAPETGALRWVHHGSSISHGYRATTTTGTWPVVAANRAGVALTNLSFSGNAMLDPFTARTIRDAPADLISLKIGVNLVSGDVMRVRAFRPAVDGFLDTIRDGHPDTPIVFVSPIWCEPVEASAGPTIQDPDRDEEWSIAAGTEAETADGKLSLRVIRAELAAIVARRRADGDERLSYLDGLSLYGEADAARMPLPDNLHPGPDVQRLIGERFAERVLNGSPHT